jgi:hypothetical protein
MTISALPKDLLRYLFSFLPVKDVGRAEMVCRAWRAAINTEPFWSARMRRCSVCALPQGHTVAAVKTVALSCALAGKTDKHARIEIPPEMLLQEKVMKEHLVRNGLYGLADEMYSCTLEPRPHVEAKDYRTLVAMAPDKEGIQHLCSHLDANRNNTVLSYIAQITGLLHDLSIKPEAKKEALDQLNDTGKLVEINQRRACTGLILSRCRDLFLHLRHPDTSHTEILKNTIVHLIEPFEKPSCVSLISIVEAELQGHDMKAAVYDWAHETIPADFMPELDEEDRFHEYLTLLHNEDLTRIRMPVIIDMLLSLGIIAKKAKLPNI